MIFTYSIIRIGGYHWWLYYKKIKAASIRIDGPKAVVREGGSVTRSSVIEEESIEEGLVQDDPWSHVDSDNKREIVETPSARSSPSLEDDIFHLDDDDHASETKFLISKSPTTPQPYNYNSISSTSLTVSVIVHSANSNST